MQFRKLQQAGIHHLQDPKQIIFMESQSNIVVAVLEGKVDVGFVRTGELERSIDPVTGEQIDLSLFKIVDPETALVVDGVPFPFPSSTTLYPEWNIAALSHVGDDIARKVQSSLLDMSRHAVLAQPLLECAESLACETELCLEQCFSFLDPSLLQSCSTRPNTAVLAKDALNNGQYAGWRTSLSLLELRNMHDETGFISRKEKTFKCVRSTELADAVVCPDKHFKRPSDEMEHVCASLGLECYGFQCLCQPCLPEFDVDLFHVSSESDPLDSGKSCRKLERCASIEQRKTLLFRAVDNNQSNATFSATVYIGSEIANYLLTQENIDGVIVNRLAIDTTEFLVGPYVVEIFFDDTPIPESPFRFEVLARDCLALTGEELRVPEPMGNCVCSQGSVELNYVCVPLVLVLSSILIPLALVCAIASYLYVRYKKRQADAVWRIDPNEVLFLEPPEILGRGKYGLVLSGDYRGTKVAVKVAKETRTKRTSLLTKGFRLNQEASIESHSQRSTFTMEDALDDTNKLLRASMSTTNSYSPHGYLGSKIRKVRNTGILFDEIRKISKMR